MKTKPISRWQKRREYKNMFDTLIEIQLRLSQDYPGHQKVSEAFGVVVNFTGDVGWGRKK